MRMLLLYVIGKQHRGSLLVDPDFLFHFAGAQLRSSGVERFSLQELSHDVECLSVALLGKSCVQMSSCVCWFCARFQEHTERGHLLDHAVLVLCTINRCLHSAQHSVQEVAKL